MPSTLHSLRDPVNLSIWILVGAISISSFWKLDYSFDMNFVKNPLSDMISCSSSTQPINSDFSGILESGIDPGYIHWTWTPIGEIPTKGFPVGVWFEKVTALESKQLGCWNLQCRTQKDIRIYESVWAPIYWAQFF